MSVMSPLYSRGPSNIGTRAHIHCLMTALSRTSQVGGAFLLQGIPKDMCLSFARRTVFSS